MRCLFFIMKMLIVVLVLALTIKGFVMISSLTSDVWRDGSKKSDDGKVVEERLRQKDDTNSGRDEGYPDTSKNTNKNISSSDIEIHKNTPEREYGEDDAENGDKEYFLTYDEMLLANNMSFGDKILGASIIRKIHKEELQNILTLANGGITMEEWSKINDILKKSLTSEEIDKLKTIIEKNKE